MRGAHRFPPLAERRRDQPSGDPAVPCSMQAATGSLFQPRPARTTDPGACRPHNQAQRKQEVGAKTRAPPQQAAVRGYRLQRMLQPVPAACPRPGRRARSISARANPFSFQGWRHARAQSLRATAGATVAAVTACSMRCSACCSLFQSQPARARPTPARAPTVSLKGGSDRRARSGAHSSRALLAAVAGCSVCCSLSLPRPACARPIPVRAS